MKNRGPANKLRHFRKAEEGQALVLTALALVVIMLMAGLGVDVGYLRYQKQQMQKAADAGALAAASVLVYGGPKWKVAALADVAANGFTATPSNGITISAYNPPIDPPFNTAPDNLNYVEVVVSQPQPTFFMRVVGGFASVPVAARSVASAAGNASGCIYVLDPTHAGSYTISGNARLTSACGLFIDSNNPSALVESGSGTCTKATYIGIVGSDSGSEDGCFPGAQPVSDIAPFTDPLAGLQPPAVPACPGSGPPAWSPPASCSYNPNPGLHCTSSATLQPGTYCGGITASSSNVTITFSSGTYVLEGGGMNITGGATANGTGVTFYNTVNAGDNPAYDAISITGGSNTSLSAATSGPLEGILFFQDRNLPAKYVYKVKDTISGDSNTNFVGALYFPLTQQLNYTGGSLATAYTVIVAYELTITGNSMVNDDYSTIGGTSPIHSAVLVQ
jgi:Flp pilus assembly protein TadG